MDQKSGGASAVAERSIFGLIRGRLISRGTRALSCWNSAFTLRRLTRVVRAGCYGGVSGIFLSATLRRLKPELQLRPRTGSEPIAGRLSEAIPPVRNSK